MAEANVVLGVKFRGPKRGQVEYREREPGTGCYLHKRFELDPDSRRVYCQECGLEVDAFTALESFARDYQHHRDAVTRLTAETRRVAERLEDLKRLERNAKARIRRRREESAR